MKKYNYKSYWEKNFKAQKHGEFLKDISEQLSKINPSPKTILELGSGEGFVSKEIKINFSCHLTGIDIITGNIWLDEHVKADITEYDTDKRYDALIARYVLLHIKPDHIKSLLEKMFKWAKDIIIIDYDPLVDIPLAPYNFKHDFSMFPNKKRLSAYNSMFFT